MILRTIVWRNNMKNVLKYILSLTIFFGAVPTVTAMDFSDRAGMEEVKKKKKKGKKIKKGEKGKICKKKGFYSKVFGKN